MKDEETILEWSRRYYAGSALYLNGDYSMEVWNCQHCGEPLGGHRYCSPKHRAKARAVRHRHYLTEAAMTAQVQSLIAGVEAFARLPLMADLA